MAGKVARTSYTKIALMKPYKKFLSPRGAVYETRSARASSFVL